MGDCRGGGEFISLRQHEFDLIGGQDFDRTVHGGTGKRMGVDAEKKRSIDFLLAAV